MKLKKIHYICHTFNKISSYTIISTYMGVFFSLFSGAFGCVFYGLIIALFIIVSLYFVLSLLSKGIVRTIPFWISMGVLFVLLFINMSVMVGAFKVKSATGAMEIWLNQQLHTVSGIADIDTSQKVGEMLDDQFPILSHYIDLFDFSGHTFQELPTVMADTIRSEMNSQILKNVLWSLGFIIAATLVSMYFDKGENYNGRSPRTRHRLRNSNINSLNKPRNGKPHFNRNRRHRL